MTQQHNVLGPLIAGNVLETVIGRVFVKMAVDPNLALDVPAVRELVAETVRRELEAREQQSTNSEPAYQSRVAQGSLASVFGAGTLIVQLWTDGMPNTPEDYTAPAMIPIGAAWALYGRFIAKKPMGA